MTGICFSCSTLHWSSQSLASSSWWRCTQAD